MSQILGRKDKKMFLSLPIIDYVTATTQKFIKKM